MKVFQKQSWNVQMFTRDAVSVPAATSSAASRSPSPKCHYSRWRCIGSEICRHLTRQVSPKKASAQEQKRKHV
jgi:hypothetical protein